VARIVAGTTTTRPHERGERGLDPMRTVATAGTKTRERRLWAKGRQGQLGQVGTRFSHCFMIQDISGIVAWSPRKLCPNASSSGPKDSFDHENALGLPIDPFVDAETSHLIVTVIRPVDVVENTVGDHQERAVLLPHTFDR